MSDCLLPHGVQYTRPPCWSLTPRVYSNSRPLSQWCHPTISSSVASFSWPVFPRVICSESALCLRGPKYWSFSLSISPSSEYSGLISFRTDQFDLLTVQAVQLLRAVQLLSLLQYHNSKASVLQHSAFFHIHYKLGREFPGSPVVRTSPFYCQGPRFDPWPENKGPTSHAVQPKDYN